MRAAVAIGLVAGLSVAPGPLSSQSTPARIGAAIERAAKARNERTLTSRYDPTFRKYTKRYFGPLFDWHYFKAQGFAESGLNPNARSWVGARGVMQLMPSTYRAIASRRPEFGPIDQPEWNIAAGIMHDRYLWTLWRPTVPEADRHRFMFASYNAGEGTIGRALAAARAQVGQPGWSSVEQVAPTVKRWRYTETLGYVRRIDSAYAKLARP